MPPCDSTQPANSSPTAARRTIGAWMSRREQCLLLLCVVLAHIGIAATLATCTTPRPQAEAARVTVTLIPAAAPTPAPPAPPAAPAPAATKPTPAPAPTPPAPKAPAPSKRPKTAPTRPPAPITPPSAPAPQPASAPVADVPLRDPSPVNVDATPERIVEARYDAAYLNNPEPDYPLRSRRMHEQGRVLLRVFVTRDGRPDKIELSGSSGHPRLDRAALAGVAQWRFVPARQGQESVDSWIIVPIVYKLEGR